MKNSSFGATALPLLLCCLLPRPYSYSYSYRVTLFYELFSEESCSVIGLSEKMGLQLWSELSATVERWAEVRWKCHGTLTIVTHIDDKNQTTDTVASKPIKLSRTLTWRVTRISATLHPYPFENLFPSLLMFTKAEVLGKSSSSSIYQRQAQTNSKYRVKWLQDNNAAN